MSAADTLSAAVVKGVTDQVAVADLLGNDRLDEAVDAEALSVSVGREVGGELGREMGAAIGREVHHAVARGLEEERAWSAIVEDVADAVRTGFVDGLEGLAASESVRAIVEELGQGDGDTEEEATDADQRPADGDEEATDAETDESRGATADEARGATADETDAEGPAAEDLDDLRRETLEEFLAVLAYEDLQSIAKDVDVKANLSREEMTDRIVDAVTSGDSTLEDVAEAESS